MTDKIFIDTNILVYNFNKIENLKIINPYFRTGGTNETNK